MSRMINTIKSKTAIAAIGAMMAAAGTPPPVGVWPMNPMKNSCTEETLTEKLAKEKIQLVTYTCMHYRYDTQIPYTTHQHTQINLTKAVQLAKKAIGGSGLGPTDNPVNVLHGRPYEAKLVTSCGTCYVS